MLLIDELKKLKQTLLNQSSFKERVFYGYLTGESLNPPPKKDLTEIEQICHSAFCADNPANNDLPILIEIQRKKQPISGMHYSKNLIELSAMAKDNVEWERENLESYCTNNSSRDFYILSNLFPNIFSNPPAPQGAIDEIALCLYNREFPQERWKPLFFEALQETSDLMDFYVLEGGYLKAMDDNPIVHQVREIIYVTQVLDAFVKRCECRIRRVIGILIFMVLVSICSVLGYFIFTAWNKTEPLITAIEILFLISTASFGAFAGIKPDRIKIFNLFRERIIDWRFRSMGFDRFELKERLNRLGKHRTNEPPKVR